jgi:SAM-dependent methyltransferase
MSRDACPICRGLDATPILTASDQPILLNHLLPTGDAARSVPRATLDFRGCNACGFVWNAAFDPSAIRYGPGYVNDQSGSAIFREHLASVERRCAELVTGIPGSLVEIGCGQGHFLASLCRTTGRSGIGFDPALEKPSAPGHEPALYRAAFDVDTAASLAQPVALIYSRHVLEHLPDPSTMLASIADVLDRSPRGAALLEVPTFDWIARHGAFFDLFNEHCSLFSPHAMRRALRDRGLHDCSVESAFGGQYLIATARRGERQAAPRAAPETHAAIDFHEARARLGAERDAWRDWFEERCGSGPVFLWGAGAKGVSLVCHLELDCDRVPAIVDVNPAKQGLHAPVHGQPIIAPAELCERVAAADGDATVLIMNPNYEREIAHTLAELGCACRVEVAHERTSRPGSRPLEVHR